MHPSFRKYEKAYRQIHEIWSDYTDIVEYISLDEGFLDVTHSEHLFGGAANIGLEIRSKTRDATDMASDIYYVPKNGLTQIKKLDTENFNHIS